jgi:uncharacterized membrane protein
MAIALVLHLVAAVVWVGGMFFAFMVLRPVAAGTLEAPQRLILWSRVFTGFFPWVWFAILSLLVTGYPLLFGLFGSMANAPIFVHIMQGLGLIMMLIFAHVFFAPTRRLKRAVSAQDWEAGARNLAQIRRLVGTNLILGLMVIIVAGGGRMMVV